MCVEKHFHSLPIKVYLKGGQAHFHKYCKNMATLCTTLFNWDSLRLFSSHGQQPRRLVQQLLCRLQNAFPCILFAEIMQLVEPLPWANKNIPDWLNMLSFAFSLYAACWGLIKCSGDIFKVVYPAKYINITVYMFWERWTEHSQVHKVNTNGLSQRQTHVLTRTHCHQHSVFVIYW